MPKVSMVLNLQPILQQVMTDQMLKVQQLTLLQMQYLLEQETALHIHLIKEVQITQAILEVPIILLILIIFILHLNIVQHQTLMDPDMEATMEPRVQAQDMEVHQAMIQVTSRHLLFTIQQVQCIILLRLIKTTSLLIRMKMKKRKITQ